MGLLAEPGGALTSDSDDSGEEENLADVRAEGMRLALAVHNMDPIRQAIRGDIDRKAECVRRWNSCDSATKQHVKNTAPDVYRAIRSWKYWLHHREQWEAQVFGRVHAAMFGPWPDDEEDAT